MKRVLPTVLMVGFLAIAFCFTHLTAFADEIGLQSGVPEAGAVLQGEWAYYQINATASHTQIVVELTGLSDDVDLYVRAGVLPTLGDYDCRPYESGTSSETCTMPNSGATTWYIGVHGYSAGSYTVEATLSGGSGPACPDFENLTEDIGRGFGSNYNKYVWSMAEYHGSIYVGTLNVGILSGGGEVWKYSVGSGTWSRIINNGGTTTSNRGFRNMMVYNDKLYTGSGVTDNPQLYEIDDSDNWQVVGTVGYGSSIRGLAVHNGLLYIGTEDESGGEIWTYDGSSFQYLAKLPPDKNMVSALYSYKGTLYAGTWDTLGLYEIDTSELDSYNDITPNISEVNSDSGVMVLIEYMSRLYLGTMNWDENSPFSLIYTENPIDTNGWTIMTTTGFGHQNSRYAWIAKEFEGRLYVGVFNPDTLGKLYIIDEYDNWELCVDDGFDGVYNWGLRSMAVYDGRLYIGTAAELTNYFGGGCQVWATLPNSACTDNDGDGVTNCDGDCDDSNDTIYPGAVELCDGLDNDCDGEIDEDLAFNTYYRDADGDTYGNAGDSIDACEAPEGYILDNTDCDDSDNTIYPDAPELCDGKDNNCDGEIDEGGVCTLRGDFDYDCDVDGSDLAVFAADIGRTDCDVGDPCEGDFDGDDDVNGSDPAIFAADFGRTDCPTSE